MGRMRVRNPEYVIEIQFDSVLHLFLIDSFLGGEKDSATVAAKGNHYKIDGRAKNPNVGIGWAHKKGKFKVSSRRNSVWLLKLKHRNYVPLNAKPIAIFFVPIAGFLVLMDAGHWHSDDNFPMPENKDND